VRGARTFWIEAKSGPKETPSHHRNYRGLLQGQNGAMYLQSFSFQFVCFLFPFIKDLEQEKDTEIQGLADVGQIRHESDKNDFI
jgi:hypothetical protein